MGGRRRRNRRRRTDRRLALARVFGVAGREKIVDAAKFLDAPNGGKANLPMDVIVASQKVMLKDLAKAGLTA